jgi:hypothetical protein
MMTFCLDSGNVRKTHDANFYIFCFVPNLEQIILLFTTMVMS